jgi:hypothetical protein
MLVRAGLDRTVTEDVRKIVRWSNKPFRDGPIVRSHRMRRAIVFLLIAAVALWLAPLAFGHGGLLIMRACGANGCKKIFNGVYVLRPDDPAPTLASPPHVGPYYLLEPSNYRSPGQTEQLPPGDSPTPAFFVPDARVLRAPPDELQLGPQKWFFLTPGAEASLRAVLTDIKPFPPPRLTEVFIDGREVGDIQGYLAVYEPFAVLRQPLNALPDEGVQIVLKTERPTPWTDGRNHVAYLSGGRLLFRDGEWVRVSDDLAHRIERPALPGGDGIPWGTVGGVAGPVAVFGLVVFVWLLTGWRRGTRPRPA